MVISPVTEARWRIASRKSWAIRSGGNEERRPSITAAADVAAERMACACRAFVTMRAFSVSEGVRAAMRRWIRSLSWSIPSPVRADILTVDSEG